MRGLGAEIEHAEPDMIRDRDLAKTRRMAPKGSTSAGATLAQEARSVRRIHIAGS